VSSQAKRAAIHELIDVHGFSQRKAYGYILKNILSGKQDGHFMHIAFETTFRNL
jgi:hypothetical protein